MNEGKQSEFEKFQEEYWEWCLKEYPELSTWTGDNRYNDRFTDLSWPAIEQRRADERQWLAKVQEFDTSEVLRTGYSLPCASRHGPWTWP